MGFVMDGWRDANDPPWFNAGKTTPASHTRNVRNGRHPMGFPLTVIADATCGTCTHSTFVQRDGRTSYHKCDMVKETGGPGTDIRAKWRGCIHWTETT